MTGKSARGVIHGKVIELSEDLGLIEGQEVEVWVEVEPARTTWGEGLLRSAFAVADDSHWDGIMEEIYQARERDRRPQTVDE